MHLITLEKKRYFMIFFHFDCIQKNFKLIMQCKKYYKKTYYFISKTKIKLEQLLESSKFTSCSAYS